MKKFRELLKREMDVDYLACVHGMSLVFIYGAELYFAGIKSIEYIIIFELFVVGYLIAWTQKLLFLKERIYGKREFWIRAALWCILPNVWCFVAARPLQWYVGVPDWVEPFMYLFMFCYYVMVLWSIQVFYKEDTREMNDLLMQYKTKKKNREEEELFHEGDN